MRIHLAVLKNIQLYLDTFVESLNSADSVIIYDSTITTNSNQFSEKSADHGSVAVIKKFWIWKWVKMAPFHPLKSQILFCTASSQGI